MDINDFARQIENLVILDDPVRRKVYLYVVGHGDDVSRDDVAQATGVSRALAAFHLDRLVEADLLQASFRRLSGREGPGAGRPSKIYRRSSSQFDVSLPQRRYELAAHVFARALAKVGSESTLDALRDVARERGKELAQETQAGRGVPLSRITKALRACGFEPQTGESSEIVLRNCPFDSLRTESRELICSMNLALIEGLLAGLQVEGVRARLSPSPGTCCVVLEKAQS